MNASQQIATRSSGNLAGLDELDEILIGAKEPPQIVDDPTELSREIMAQLLAASTDDELEQVGQAQGWSELEGVPIEIKGFRWRPSTFEGEGGAPVFFVVQGVRLDNGETVTLTTGASNVLAQLSNLARRGRLPGAVRMLVVSEKPTASGYRPHWLVTPEAYKETDRARGEDVGSEEETAA